MSEQELLRAAVFGQVKSQDWALVEAAERLGLSYRQTKRLWKCYQQAGATGLVPATPDGVRIGPSRRRCAPRCCG